MSESSARYVWESLRDEFPALKRTVNGEPAIFFDGPAGTQVPQQVIDAVSHYYATCNANHGGAFATSSESDAMLGAAHQAAADFLGASDPATVSFGANMTTLTFAISRALARTWSAGDEVVVTQTEHDANYTPWLMAAEDAGARVRVARINHDDTTLDVAHLKSLINRRTKLVAIGAASNATGTANPIQQVCDLARSVGTLTFVDAVHYAPHRLIDVEHLGCDLLACSAYKFFGPHVGILWGRRELLESLTAYKVQPADDTLPSKWMTGTQNHACLAGTLAAIDYLADVGRRETEQPTMPRRQALAAAMQAIGCYESDLVMRLLAGLAQLPGYRVWGITDPARLHERLPTVSITHDVVSPVALAQELGRRGCFVWHGNYYALPLTTALGVEPDGMVRIGIVHYNTAEEVDRLLAMLAEIGE